MYLLQVSNFFRKAPCEYVCGFMAVGVWMSTVTLLRLLKRKILGQKQYAQASLCKVPPRSVTVCDTVRSSPALERTAFLWKYTTNRVWITQSYECKFCA